MKYIRSINAFLVEESDIKNGVLHINEIVSPQEDPKFIATDEVLSLCKKVVFGDEIFYIPQEAFYSWPIEGVEFGKNTRMIGSGAFIGCKLKKLDTSNIERIGDKAFANNEDLKEVYIGKKVRGLSSGIFSNNSSLKKVTIDPDNASINILPSYFFQNDSQLESIENLRDVFISLHAVSGCKNLKLTLSQQSVIKNCDSSTVPFDNGVELTILVDDYNVQLQSIVQKLKEAGVVVSAIPVTKKAAKQLFPTNHAPEEASLAKAKRRLSRIQSEIPKLSEEIFSLQTKVQNLPVTESEPVVIGVSKKTL